MEIQHSSLCFKLFNNFQLTAKESKIDILIQNIIKINNIN